MARLRRISAIKRPLKKFFTASNRSPSIRWWWAQRDQKWRDDAEPVPANEIPVIIPETHLQPSHTFAPAKPTVNYLPAIGVWDDSALWSDNVDWRD